MYDDPAVCLEGVQAISRIIAIQEAMRFVLCLIYGDNPAELQLREKRERNGEIYRRYLAGEDSVVLARVYSLSDRRIRNIVEHERKRRGQ